MQGVGRASARSHDGRLVAVFEAANDGVAIVPIDGGPRRTLVRQFPNLASTSLQFSPDDRFVYFVAGSGRNEDTVWRVPVAGGAPQSTGVIVRINHDMSLSPDGRHLAIKSHWPSTEVWVWERR
jgi:Tol biopolymer transport system component